MFINFPKTKFSSRILIKNGGDVGGRGNHSCEGHFTLWPTKSRGYGSQ